MRRKKSGKNRSVSVWVQIGIDIFLAINILFVFAYFHHVKPRQAIQGVALVETVESDVRFSYGCYEFDNSSRMVLIVNASTQKDIIALTCSVEYDGSQLVYQTFEAGSGLSSQKAEVAQSGNVLTLSADTDGSAAAIFPVDPTPEDDSDNCIFSLWFEKVNVPEDGVYDISVSVNPARLIASDGTVATYSLYNGEVALASSGDFRDRFPDKFTDGDVVETKKSYMSSNANVSYDDFTVEIEGKKVVYHKVEIYVRNYEYFRTAIVGNTLVGGMNHASGTPYLARKKDAITAINGDYCSGHNIGPVVRNGVLYRTSAFDDIFVMYTDGSMKAYEKGTYADMNFESGDIWQAWSFGPSLLTADGQPKTEFNSVLTDLHPRTAIGYYEPGHYCFVTIDGRNSGGSRGMTLEEMSKLFYDFGCTAAYNLDGGRTSVAVWKDKIINNPYGGGRPCSDIVYIPKK